MEHLPHLLSEENRDEEEQCPLCDMFDDLFPQKPTFSYKPWSPPTDVFETEKEIIIKIELAGMIKDDISVTVEKNILSIQGQRKDSVETEKKDFHLMEIHYGMFERRFRLPPGLQRDQVKANYENGFLIIRIPKRFHKPKEIKIEER